jgi:hypothetical protein
MPFSYDKKTKVLNSWTINYEEFINYYGPILFEKYEEYLNKRIDTRYMNTIKIHPFMKVRFYCKQYDKPPREEIKVNEINILEETIDKTIIHPTKTIKTVAKRIKNKGKKNRNTSETIIKEVVTPNEEIHTITTSRIIKTLIPESRQSSSEVMYVNLDICSYEEEIIDVTKIQELQDKITVSQQIIYKQNQEMENNKHEIGDLKKVILNLESIITDQSREIDQLRLANNRKTPHDESKHNQIYNPTDISEAIHDADEYDKYHNENNGDDDNDNNDIDILF